MKVKYGNGKTEYGPGVDIELTGEEVAIAIDGYLVAHKVYIRGPRTIRVNGKLCDNGSIYVDPSGHVIYLGIKISGRGEKWLLGGDVVYQTILTKKEAEDLVGKFVEIKYRDEDGNVSDKKIYIARFFVNHPEEQLLFDVVDIEEGESAVTKVFDVANILEVNGVYGMKDIFNDE